MTDLENIYSPDDRVLGLDEMFPDELTTTDPEVTAETERIPRRVHGDKIELWLRAAHYYPWLITEMALPRFVWEDRELSAMTSTPYDLVRRAQPKGTSSSEFSFIVCDNVQARRYESVGYVSLDQPSTVYPVWDATSDPRRLVRLCERYADNGWDRIFISKVPGTRPDPSRPNTKPQIMEWLHRVNNEFPHVKMHYHWAKRFRWAFGMSFYSVDMSPLRNRFSNHYVTLPNGRELSVRSLRRQLKWVHLLGYSTSELLNPKSRLRFTLAAQMWAAENWNNPHGIVTTVGRQRADPIGLLSSPPPASSRRKAINLRTAPLVHDPDRFPQSSPRSDEPWLYVQPVTHQPFVAIHKNPADVKDKIMCGTCSLADRCRVYREGELCGKEESPMAEIVAAVGSRNADVVRSVLARVVEAQVSRYERSARAFEADEQSDVLDLKRSKRLTEMENAAIRSTETLLKIVDPEYRDSSIPAIKVGSTVNVYNPRVLVADVMKAMEAEGFDRSQVDPNLVLQAIENQGVVEGEIVNDQG